MLLKTHIEDSNGLSVQIVTVRCAGDCVQVRAVPTGGNPGYHFSWSDGVTTAAREICASADTDLSVEVVDTPLEANGFGNLATADVTVEVLTCGVDTLHDDLCLENPSLEGTPAGSVSTASPWVDCAPPLTEASTIWSAGSSFPGQSWTSPAATDGSSYLMLSTNAGVGPQGASERLCATLTAGTTHYLLIDLASPMDSGQTGVSAGLELWGGDSSCSQKERLWTSPPGQLGWQTYCMSLTPTADTTYLMLAPGIAGVSTLLNTGRVLVDHLVPVSECP